MDKYDPKDAIDYAMTGKPVDFENAITHIIAGKLPDAIEARREEIGRALFAPEPVETAEVEPDEEKTEETTEE